MGVAIGLLAGLGLCFVLELRKQVKRITGA